MSFWDTSGGAQGTTGSAQCVASYSVQIQAFRILNTLLSLWAKILSIKTQGKKVNASMLSLGFSRETEPTE